MKSSRFIPPPKECVDMVLIKMEEYKELLIIKGKYLEIKEREGK